jgi:two-component system LytT family response regulator
MNILIIEDEPLVAVSLAKIVRELEPAATIEGPLSSVSESKNWLDNHTQPDLILSDIQLSDGISLDIFSDRPACPVIFTTAFNEYAIRAFKLNSIDYLLKPVEKKELQAALQKFHLLQSKFSNQEYLQQMMELFNNFKQVKKYKERFAVNMGRAVTLVSAHETACFVKEELIYLINTEGKKFIAEYRSLDEIEELLDPRIFFRANRQYIINLSSIENYRTDDTGKLVLKLKAVKPVEVIVSKEKAAEFRKWFDGE